MTGSIPMADGKLVITLIAEDGSRYRRVLDIGELAEPLNAQLAELRVGVECPKLCGASRQPASSSGGYGVWSEHGSTVHHYSWDECELNPRGHDA